ncbi:hypothetical protein [Micromonospora sp. NBC_01813]|uniref:hypothetical protein n=1 Tax=Micromonospora sp. NBC_01813 TaxID=2975988 RepID=UPI002DDA89F3|nr:hypothetical protein [Micromonospora sp. NBC_01813]WSA11578.1 hypothetical protein OG958_12785 [Micromonospora sp. NBC_01813]
MASQQIFTHLDVDNDVVTVEDFGDGELTVLVHQAGIGTSGGRLSPEAVTRLRAALRPYEEYPGSELAEEWRRGRESAIDDHDLITREEHEAALAAALEQAPGSVLDQARVEALEKATAAAEKLRTTGAFGIGGPVSHETVLAYALFLLDQINIPEVPA